MDSTSRQANANATPDTAERLRDEGDKFAQRALRALTRSRRVLVRARSEAELLHDVCRIIVEYGYRMAWVGFAEHDEAKTVRVAAYDGYEEGYLERAQISWGEGERGLGPTGSAIRSGQRDACRDFLADERMLPWREEAIARGFRSSLVLPMIMDGAVLGALSVYASELGAFDESEVELLAELADDMAWAITSLRAREHRERLEGALAASEARVRAFIEHTPAAVALLDRDMRYMQISRRWAVDYRLDGTKIIGRSHYEVFPEIPERWKEIHRRALEGAVERCEEDAFPRADGTVDWLSWEVRPWHTEDGSIGGIVMLTEVITERIAARQSVEQYRRRAEAVLEWASDGIVGVDANGRIALFNRSAERMFGHERAFAIGRNVAELIPELPLTPPRRTGQDAGGQGAPGRGESVLVVGTRGDGTKFPMEARVSTVDLSGAPLLTVTCRDLTEEKRAEFALRESEQRLRTLTENLRDIVWLADIDPPQYLYINPAYTRIFGLPVESLLANPREWFERVHPDDRVTVNKALRDLRSIGRYDVDYRVVRDDGTVIWLHDRSFPVETGGGRSTRFAGVTEDITERKMMEERLRNAQKMDAIGQLAGGVAHDFNNILAAIVMQAGLAQRLAEQQPNLQRMLKEIGESADRGAALTRQLLQFSRQQVLEASEQDLNRVLRRITPMLERLLPIEVRVELALSGTPCLVEADPSMLEQVVMNLVVNARDAMPTGGTIHISTGHLSLTGSPGETRSNLSAGRYAFLRVRDQGSGIAPDVVARIFDPFFTTKEAGKGTGLGLSTVFGIVQQHHGDVSVTTELGHGSTFQVLLPERAGVAGAESIPPPRGLVAGGHETILLAEDDALLRSLTAEALRGAGYEVVEAESGVAARELWANRPGRIHLLATDVVMPHGLSGIDLARELRAQEPALRAVVFSGYNPGTAGMPPELGARQRFLQKPFTAEQLLEAVRGCLDE